MAATWPFWTFFVRRIWGGEARYLQLYRHEMKIGSLSQVREPAGGKGCFRVTSDPWDGWLGRPISGPEYWIGGLRGLLAVWSCESLKITKMYTFW